LKYIPPHYGKLYIFIAALGWHYRYLLTIFISMLLIFVWFTWIYKPLRALITQQHVSLEEMQKKQDACALARKTNHTLEQEIQVLHRQFMNYTTAEDITHHADVTSLLTIIEAAKKRGLQFTGCMLESDNESEWATSERVRFNFEGSLAQSHDFFTDLQSLRLLLGCSALDLTRTRDDMFNLSCVIDVYKLKELCFA
jgi:hypothetical protein